MNGPTLALSQELHALKYRGQGETFDEAMSRIAGALTEDSSSFYALRSILLDQRFLPAGRIQAAVGSPRSVTAFNCFVSGIIEDDLTSIMQRAGEAARTMRTGGGIGYDFSRLRPRGDWISTLESQASGPVSFMGIYNAVCNTISSAGHRRGAQMAVLRVDHPDIIEFVQAKRDTTSLTAFNISVGVTDSFLLDVISDRPHQLKFNGRVYSQVKARHLWEQIMRSTWDWAEPGVLFLDTINKTNNLWYCETIEATNPCGEQPLPPYGACLLGSFNLVKYVSPETRTFNFERLLSDIFLVVPAMDRVIDVTDYPLPEQRDEAISKRRMGLGVTGVANAIEAMGHPYGTPEFIEVLCSILEFIRNNVYARSASLALERGSFPLYNEAFLRGGFTSTLPGWLRSVIANRGIRNSHLLSIAPTGTISMCADNVSSGIEPVYASVVDRVIKTEEGPRVERIEDYGVRVYGTSPKTAEMVPAEDHVRVLCAAQAYIDSAASKTINVNPATPWLDFKNLYLQAWVGGAKGCTTFNPGGKRMGILTAVTPSEGAACRIDPETGAKTCDE